MLHLPFPWTGCAEGRALSQGTDGIAVCYTYNFHGQDALRAVLCHQGTDGVDVALPHRLKHVVRKTAVSARSLKHNNNNNEYLERLTRTGPKRLHVLYKYILSKFNAHTHAHTHARTHRDSHTL